MLAALPVPSDLATREPPPELGDAGADAWRVYLAEMGSNRALREADLILLRALCHAVDAEVSAAANVGEYGSLVKGRSGPVVNPMLRVMKDSTATIRQVTDVLGLNPLARIRGNLMEISGTSMVHDIRERLVARLASGSAS
jgi:P27 family predicted phage terminase small subunit